MANSGFEPPAGRRQYSDSGFVPPARRSFPSDGVQGSSQSPPPPQQAPAQPSPPSNRSSFFSFRKLTGSEPHFPEDSGASSTPAIDTARPKSQQLPADDFGNLNQSTPASRTSVTMKTSRASMLIDPYVMPRDDPPRLPSAEEPSLPSGQSPPTSQLRNQPRPSSSSSHSGVLAPRAQRALHPELKSLMSLSVAHTQKIYFSGPMVRCNERTTDGHRSSRDTEWHDVWAQLGGTTLSVWDMKAIEEANKRGSQAPPSYINVTDAFLRIVGPVTVPSTPANPAKIYQDVFTLNTAGLNLMSFSCPDREALLSWVAALRLALWEKARLEEIYTGHLLRMSLCDAQGKWKEPRTTLVRGRMEGWTKIRIAGQTEWKRVWAVVSAGSGSTNGEQGDRPTSPSTGRRHRLSSLFSSRAPSPPPPAYIPPSIALYASPKPKDRKTPILTVSGVTQAFAVYPERIELINMSTLIKVEGKIGTQDAAQSWKGREGWVLVMPELEAETVPPMEMLKWLIALHDAFELYGRPRGYTWDPFNPSSQMFAYPAGERKQDLFLQREDAESLDTRIDRMSIVREGLTGILREKMALNASALQNGRRISAPPPPRPDPALRLPPLDFGSGPMEATQGLPSTTPALSRDLGSRTVLAPITERGSTSETLTSQHKSTTESLTLGKDDVHNVSLSPDLKDLVGNNQNEPSDYTAEPIILPVFDRPIVASPPASPLDSARRLSEESYFNVLPPSRPGSKMSRVMSIDQDGSSPEDSKPLSSLAGLRSSRSSDSLSNPQVRPLPTTNLATSVVAPVTNDARLPENSTTPRPAPSSQSSYRSQNAESPRILPPTPGLALKSASNSMNSWSQPSEIRSTPPGQYTGRSPAGDSLNTISTLPTPVFGRVPSPELHASPRSIGVQLRDPGSPSSTPAPRPRSSASPPSPSYVGVDRPTSPRRTTMSPVQDPAINSRPPSSWQRESSDILISARPVSGVARGLPVPPTDRPRTSLEYATAPASDGPGIVERLRRQIAEEEGYLDEAGALYIAQRLRDGSSVGHSSSDEEIELSPAKVEKPKSASPPGDPAQLQAKPFDDVENVLSTTQRPSAKSPPPSSYPDPASADPGVSGVRPLIRKPSGARPPPRRGSNSSQSNRVGMAPHSENSRDEGDLGVDALAALTFMERDHAEAAPQARPQPKVSPPILKQHPATPPTNSPTFSSPHPNDPSNFPSSFSGSKAAERRAKAQANVAASQAAAHKPGRSGIKPQARTNLPAKGTWDSSEEEEEEEEDDDDEDGSDEDDQARGRPRNGPPPPLRSQTQTLYAPQAQHQSQLASEFGMRPNGNGNGDDTVRRARNLPSIPRSGSAAGYDPRSGTFNGRGASGGSPAHDRAYFDDDPRNAPPPRLRPDERSVSVERSANTAAAPRTNIWSTVLDPNKPSNLGPSQPSRDTFVTLESETMTKAFAPQGLLQAGLQDKQDRSAKRQEELARESGNSYVNVPTKPPPPQSGLLGAITAHERERKREGGVGAALTERERERRIAEERQRKIDELQRQQLEYAQQASTSGGAAMGGSPYDMFGGGQGFPMMNPMMMGNPMMMNPMMMGNPMMGGMTPQFTGYQPSGWGLSPQQQQMQLFAAQQAAAEAYRNAMMSFSQAGSIAPGSEIGGPTAMRAGSPGMWGGGMNSMASMYGMPPQMAPQMTGQPWAFGTPQPDFNQFNNGSPSMTAARASMFGAGGTGGTQPENGQASHPTSPAAISGSRNGTPPISKPS